MPMVVTNPQILRPLGEDRSCKITAHSVKTHVLKWEPLALLPT